MSDTTLTDLFRQQAQRLHLKISGHWHFWQAGDESALTPLCHAVHLLKGAALTASVEAVAQVLHALESDLQRGQQAEARAHWVGFSAAIQSWLTEAPRPLSIAPDGLRLALREGFVAQVRLSGQPATLHLQLDSHWPSDAAVLLDALPQLLCNALVHGGELSTARQLLSKPERLQVWLRLRCRGECFSLIVADDGRGQARAKQVPDLMAGRGWGVAAVREVVAGLPSGRLRFRCRVGMGSIVRIQWRMRERC